MKISDHPGNFPQAFTGVPIGDAPALIKTVLGVPSLPYVTTYTERGCALHLRLIAEALGARR